jgi:hypothetical protein
MQTFLEWLQTEQRQKVPQEILNGYEVGFRAALKQLLGKVKDPELRAKFQRMLECPIKDSQGRCQSFTDYILGVLVRRQIHRTTDVEDALNYVYETMMLDTKMTGEPKSTVFGGFDFDRPLGSNRVRSDLRIVFGSFNPV